MHSRRLLFAFAFALAATFLLARLLFLRPAVILTIPLRLLPLPILPVGRATSSS